MAVGAPRARRVRRVGLGVLLALVLVAGVLAIVFARGDYQTFPRTSLLWPAQQAKAPSWTKPCWPTARWTDKALCEHVSGRVVWLQKHDPDGDGDRHLLIVDRLHPRIVKLVKTMPVDRLPKLGAHVDAVGWLMKGASGHDEINAQSFTWSGTTKTTQSGAVLSLIRKKTVG
jgi:hypothetical protein